MTLVLAASVFALLSTGVYLVLQKSYLRVVLGLCLLSHAVHLILLVSGGEGSAPPILSTPAGEGERADPLPQAFVLTAIVISMAMTLYLLAGIAALAVRGRSIDVEPPEQSDEGRDPDAVRRELGRAGDEP